MAFRSYLRSAVDITSGKWISTLLVVLYCQMSLAQSERQQESVSRLVIAAIPSEFPPQYSMDQQGKPTGFAIDVMNAIASRANLEIDYRIFPSWADTTNALATGDAALIPNMGITEARKVYANFTVPVETFTVSVFVRQDSIGINSLLDLPDRTVGVVENNVAVQLFRDRGQSIEIKPNPRELLFDLLSGQIDVIAYPEPVLLRLARDIGVEDQIRVLAPPLKEIKRAIAVGKGRDQLFRVLDSAAADFVGSAEYETIYTRWYSRPEPYWNVIRVSWSAGIALGIILLLSFAWRYYSLNRLNRLNRDLSEETNRRSKAENQLRELNLQLESKIEERTEELQRRNAVLHAIDQLSSHFIKESDPFVLYPELLEQILTLTNSQYGLIGDVLQDDNGNLYLKNYALSNLAWNEETNKLYEKHLESGLEFHNLDNLFGLVITGKKPVLANHASEDPRRGGLPTGHPEIRSFLGIPVYFGEDIVGEIGLANRPGGYDDKMITELEPVAIALGQIIVARWNREKRLQAERELELLASTDHLTGIANRRKMLDRLTIEVNRCKRYGEPLSLVMLDIDHFKQVNDELGHDAGDTVLIELTEQIQAHVREVDLFARWGGEEFLILLPQTDIETAKSLVDRVRVHISEYRFSKPKQVTISLGLTTLVQSDNSDSLVSRADKALYQAKESGRNCSVVIT